MIPWIILYTNYAFQDFYRICNKSLQMKQRKRLGILGILVSRKSSKTKPGLDITSPKYPKYKLYYSLYDSLDTTFSSLEEDIFYARRIRSLLSIKSIAVNWRVNWKVSRNSRETATPLPAAPLSVVRYTWPPPQPSINILWEHGREGRGGEGSRRATNI